jgi:hypothetical protein
MFITAVCLSKCPGSERYVILTPEAFTRLIITTTLLWMWRRVVWQIVTKFSEKPAAYVLRIRVTLLPWWERQLVVIYLPDYTESLMQHYDIARMLFVILNNIFSVVLFFLQLTLMFRVKFLALKSYKPPIFSALFNSAAGSIFSYVSARCIPILYTLSCFPPCSSGLHTHSSCLLCKDLYLIVSSYLLN